MQHQDSMGNIKHDNNQMDIESLVIISLLDQLYGELKML